MSVEKRVLCSASRYTKKYYLNPEFDRLPTAVKDELKIMCVLFTEEVGGVILLMFEEDGNLRLMTEAEEEFIHLLSLLNKDHMYQTMELMDSYNRSQNQNS